MESTLKRRVHPWFVGCMLLVILTSVTVWIVSRDTLPPSAQIATGSPGGVFYKIGELLSQKYKDSTEHVLIVRETAGSQDNRELLINSKVDVAVLQGDFINTRHLSVIAPLYLEMIHVIVRSDSGITNMNGLAGRRIILGPVGSGMRKSGLTILHHYQLEDKVREVPNAYFTDLLEDSSIDAAIVTTGILNDDLVRLARSERIGILPLHVDALARKHSFFYAASVPPGLYSERPAVPSETIETVGATAYLATRRDASHNFVKSLLIALHEEGIGVEFPNLIQYHDALDMTPVPMHPAARLYFTPPDQLGFFTNILESLAAMKELILALGAGCWLIWDRWKRLQAEERDRMLAGQKDYLDSFLSRTLDIEAEQIHTANPLALQAHLDKVTEIKLEALHELTHEDLRSDRAFIIFLTQCANLINKIQFKILHPPQVAEGTPPQTDLSHNKEDPLSSPFDGKESKANQPESGTDQDSQHGQES